MITRSRKRKAVDQRHIKGGNFASSSESSGVNQSGSPVFNIHIHVHSPNNVNQTTVTPKIKSNVHLHLDGGSKIPVTCSAKKLKFSPGMNKKKSKLVRKKELKSILDSTNNSRKRKKEFNDILEANDDNFNPLYTSSQLIDSSDDKLKERNIKFDKNSSLESLNGNANEMMNHSIDLNKSSSSVKSNNFSDLFVAKQNSTEDKNDDSETERSSISERSTVLSDPLLMTKESGKKRQIANAASNCSVRLDGDIIKLKEPVVLLTDIMCQKELVKKYHISLVVEKKETAHSKIKKCAFLQETKLNQILDTEESGKLETKRNGSRNSKEALGLSHCSNELQKKDFFCDNLQSRSERNESSTGSDFDDENNWNNIEIVSKTKNQKNESSIISIEKLGKAVGTGDLEKDSNVLSHNNNLYKEEICEEVKKENVIKNIVFEQTASSIVDKLNFSEIKKVLKTDESKGEVFVSCKKSKSLFSQDDVAEADAGEMSIDLFEDVNLPASRAACSSESKLLKTAPSISKTDEPSLKLPEELVLDLEWSKSSSIKDPEEKKIIDIDCDVKDDSSCLENQKTHRTNRVLKKSKKHIESAKKPVKVSPFKRHSEHIVSSSDSESSESFEPEPKENSNRKRRKKNSSSFKNNSGSQSFRMVTPKKKAINIRRSSSPSEVETLEDSKKFQKVRKTFFSVDKYNALNKSSSSSSLEVTDVDNSKPMGMTSHKKSDLVNKKKSDVKPISISWEEQSKNDSDIEFLSNDIMQLNACKAKEVFLVGERAKESNEDEINGLVKRNAINEIETTSKTASKEESCKESRVVNENPTEIKEEKVKHKQNDKKVNDFDEKAIKFDSSSSSSTSSLSSSLSSDEKVFNKNEKREVGRKCRVTRTKPKRDVDRESTSELEENEGKVFSRKHRKKKKKIIDDKEIKEKIEKLKKFVFEENGQSGMVGKKYRFYSGSDSDGMIDLKINGDSPGPNELKNKRNDSAHENDEKDDKPKTNDEEAEFEKETRHEIKKTPIKEDSKIVDVLFKEENGNDGDVLEKEANRFERANIEENGNNVNEECDDLGECDEESESTNEEATVDIDGKASVKAIENHSEESTLKTETDGTTSDKEEMKEKLEKKCENVARKIDAKIKDDNSQTKDQYCKKLQDKRQKTTVVFQKEKESPEKMEGNVFETSDKTKREIKGRPEESKKAEESESESKMAGERSSNVKRTPTKDTGFCLKEEFDEDKSDGSSDDSAEGRLIIAIESDMESKKRENRPKAKVEREEDDKPYETVASKTPENKKLNKMSKSSFDVIYDKKNLLRVQLKKKEDEGRGDDGMKLKIRKKENRKFKKMAPINKKKSKSSRKSSSSKKLKRAEMKHDEERKPVNVFESEDYISLDVSGPTKFAVANLDKLKPPGKHAAESFRNAMLFGDRVKRFSSSRVHQAYKLKQKACEKASG